MKVLEADRAQLPAGGVHPAAEDLQSFMAGKLAPAEVRVIVRHLLKSCPTCKRVTRRLWSFGEQRPRPLPARPSRVAREKGLWR